MSDEARPTLAERRLRARKRVELPVRYRVVGETRADASRDLSLGGLFLACQSPLPLGTRVELLLGEEALRVEAEVVRVVWGGRRAGRPIEPGMALSFVSLSAEDEQRLSRLLATV